MAPEVMPPAAYDAQMQDLLSPLLREHYRRKTPAQRAALRYFLLVYMQMVDSWQHKDTSLQRSGCWERAYQLLQLLREVEGDNVRLPT
jgi:hypothetical protein